MKKIMINLSVISQGKPSALFKRTVLLTACLTLGFSVRAQQLLEPSTESQLPAIKSKKVAESLLQDIVRVNNRLLVVGERGHIAYSDDNAKTWLQSEVPTRQMLNAVHFVNAEQGWAVGYDGLVLNTVDGGKNWALQLDGIKFMRQRMADKIPELEAQKNQLEKAKLDAAAAMNKAESAGETDTSALQSTLNNINDRLSDAENGINDAHDALLNTVANPLLGVWFRDKQHGFVVGAFGEFLKTDNGGATWISVIDRLENPDHSHLNAIIGKGDLMFIVGEAGHVYRSTDAGEHWTALESPDPENGSFFTVDMQLKNSTVANEQIFIGGLRGAMYRSVDQGNSWIQVEDKLHNNINAFYFTGDNVVLAVGNDGALLLSHNQGHSFEQHVRKNRRTIAGATTAANGNYVLVGAGGVQTVPPRDM